MRKFITLLAVIATFLFLVAGHFYWKEKTSAHTPVEKKEPVEAKEKAKTKKPVSVDEDLLTVSANWPKEAQDAFKKATSEGRPYKIAFVGSESIGKEDGGWSVMLKDALSEAYGNAVEVGIFEYDEQSDEFITNGHAEEVAKFKPDFVLFEPFTLNDNGNIEVEDNHENIKTFISDVKDAVVVLQPPHPIHGATFYPGQVDQLKAFANAEGLDYLDHWSEWPDQSNEELRTYLQDQQSAPNEKGHEVWFEFLRDYFIAK
ncbi:SGNH/GDSL hydrolase family protein [Siminovitchia fordii]|uniref:SGNH/GDSL hydrolase family protein n=1 Tax=Siminovitchia fordii TaxID=254759 RepID=UPI000367EB0D|nr:SGNH/GDSL hydrolase family protein [Siminovitchia fordii]